MDNTQKVSPTPPVLLALGALLLLLVGCGSSVERDTPRASGTAEPRRPSFTLAPVTVAPTDVSLQPPTRVAPTATEWASRDPTSTAVPSPQPSPTATPVAPPDEAGVPAFGVEIGRIPSGQVMTQAVDAGVYWIRYNALLWADVEPVPGARDWQAVADLEAEMLAARAAGMQVILIVRKTPDWAQKLPGHSCGPVAPDALDDFARFMADAAERYGAPPYGVKHWELGNEPDIDASLVKPDAVFGCWGDAQDPYYGGEYYGQMLQAVYPAIKAANPAAQVLIGGLLLDKEPAMDDLPNPPGRFLEGILQAGGGEFFDLVSFHAYALYDGQVHDWELLNAAWVQRGGIVAGKADYLREVLSASGYDKPLALTESGLLCAGCSSPPPEGFLVAQAAYVPRLYARSIALGLVATIWYPLDGPGWREAGLLDKEQSPRPGYHAFQTMTRLLGQGQYLGPVEEMAGLEGYAFSEAGEQVWVLWSSTDAPIQIPVPPRLLAVYDTLGVPVIPTDGYLVAGFSPIYLEISAP
jgi:hypothetical protein